MQKDGACTFSDSWGADAWQVDVPLALGQCVGSAVFVLTFCMAGVIYWSPLIVTMPPGPYVRDSLFYLVAVLLTAWAVKDSKFELHESCSLVLWCAPCSDVSASASWLALCLQIECLLVDRALNFVSTSSHFAPEPQIYD